VGFPLVCYDILKNSVQTFAPIITDFGVFEYHVLEDGSLSALDGRQLISLTRDNGLIPIAVITNLTESGFSTQLTKRITKCALAYLRPDFIELRSINFL